MLETLVTLVVVSLWLLGSAGVQTIALKLNKSSQFRNQAVVLATEMAERMETNKAGAVAGSYSYGGGTLSSGVDCIASVCSAAELAAFDLYEWSARARSTLPSAAFSISGSAANPVTYTILISWAERRTEQTYATAGTTEVASYTATKTIYQ
jgi:type IV pilus assembly protein PilV